MAATRLTNFAALNLIAYNGGVAFTPFYGLNKGNRDQLWVSDSTGTTGLVKDLGSQNNSSPAYLTAVNGKLMFTAYSGTSDAYGDQIWKLWSSDGAIGSTNTSVITASDGSSVNLFRPSGDGYTTTFNGLLFFAGTTAAKGTELWKSDGTSAGTTLVKDIASGSDSSYPYQLTPFGRQLLFFSYGSKGADLWKSDGSSSGTVKLAGLVNTGYEWPYPDQLTAVGSQVFFTSAANKLGQELWRTDGTKAGTVLVKDIFTGKDSYGYANSSYPKRLTGVGSTLFFIADSPTGSGELWVSDGSSLGTRKVLGDFKDAGDLQAVGTSLYFAATNASSGDRELWKVDSTSLTASLAVNINPNGSSNPTDLTMVGNQLFFGANNGTNGQELMSYTPSTSTLTLEADINTNPNPSSSNSDPSSITISGGNLYFNADDGSTRGLWSLPTDALTNYNPPAFTQQASVSGNTLTVLINQAVSGKDGSINPGFFKVLVGGVAVAATGASLDGTGTRLTLTLASSPASSAITDVFYCPPAGAGIGTLISQGSGNTPMEPQTINGQTTATSFLSSVSVSSLASTYTTLELLGSAAINGSGNTAANTIVGNSAANTLNGLLGNDQLSGGLGFDSFLFSTAPNSLTNRDTVTDFSSGSDRIVLSRSVFNTLGSASTVSSSQLVVFSSLTPLVPTSAMRLLFNSDTRVLSYDSDGNGSKAAVDVAVLTGITTLSTADFLLVK